LVQVSKLADGQFGGIYLVRDGSKSIYSVKALNKALLEEYEVQKFINEEKKILSSVTFPFLIQMARTFQTDSFLFYLEEFVCGEDFYEVIRNIGLLSTEDSQFYGATIILILEYLNDNQIVCRDIKPENFMVDSKGYMKLINLSTSKIIRTENNQMSKTFTIIGTPHYMAPDIILGKGYNNLVDLWSLGVCLYEFLCGVLPFGDSAEGPYDIYEEIMQSELKFP
jgi:cGMP-dependent protein kinase 1